MGTHGEKWQALGMRTLQVALAPALSSSLRLAHHTPGGGLACTVLCTPLPCHWPVSEKGRTHTHDLLAVFFFYHLLFAAHQGRAGHAAWAQLCL